MQRSRGGVRIQHKYFSPCTFEFNTWFNIDFYSLRSEKEQERNRKTGDYNRLSIHHCRCSAICDSPKQLRRFPKTHTRRTKEWSTERIKETAWTSRKQRRTRSPVPTFWLSTLRHEVSFTYFAVLNVVTGRRVSEIHWRWMADVFSTCSRRCF